MRQAVSGILRFKGKVLVIKRQSFLSVFPGYDAFPGGKVDKGESLFDALKREIQEECGFNIKKSLVKEIGVATTPSFNPYRFETHYFIVELDSKPTFVFDKGEVFSSFWLTPTGWLERYRKGECICVPPMIKIMNHLKEKKEGIGEFDLCFNEDKEVPMLESVFGLKQFMPLSHTFPPANRTNCFLVGDKEGERFLIDPSPKDQSEYQKLTLSLEAFGFDHIFLTHHHSDHHEYAPDLAREYKVPMHMSQDTYDRICAKKGEYYFHGIHVRLRKEGEALTETLGKRVLIYSFPGHDEGQLGLMPEDHSWCLVSDLIQTVGTVTIGGEEADMLKYFKSLERVIDLNPMSVFPSHGIGLGGVYKLQKTLRHRQKREEDIETLIKNGKKFDEIVSLIYFDLDQRLLPYAKATVKSHINKLVKEKRVEPFKL